MAHIDSLLSQSALFGWMCQILVGCHARDTRRKSNGEIIYPGDVPDAPEAMNGTTVYAAGTADHEESAYAPTYTEPFRGLVFSFEQNHPDSH